MSSDLRVNEPTQNGEDGEAAVEELRAWAPAIGPQKPGVVLSENSLPPAERKSIVSVSLKFRDGNAW